MDLTGIGEAASAAKSILGMIFPDKTEEEKNRMAAAMSMLQAQTDINKAEAQSTDPLQHWRGGLGWVCVMGYAWNFVVQPLIGTVSAAAGHPLVLAPLDIAPLITLTTGMLGLGALHVYQSVSGK